LFQRRLSDGGTASKQINFCFRLKKNSSEDFSNLKNETPNFRKPKQIELIAEKTGLPKEEIGKM